MNIFESTFEKHKQLVLEKTAQQNPNENPTEKEGVSAEFKQEFWKDFNDASVAQFVSKYEQIARDSKIKAFLTAGRDDEDDAENFKVKKATTNVSKLIPCQNEIGFKNSLRDLCEIAYPAVPQELDRILDGNQVILGAPRLGEVPIIIFAGKYIIDGHHRWSKIACANPDASVVVLDFNNKMLQNNPEKALKAFHLAIAQYQNEMPTEEKSGANLFTSNPQAVHSYVKENLQKPESAKLLEIYKKHGKKISKSGNINSGTVANYIARNATATIIGKTPATDTPRKFMPQLDKAPAAVTSLQQGVINFSPDKVTETSLFESTFNKFKNLYTK